MTLSQRIGVVEINTPNDIISPRCHAVTDHCEVNYSDSNLVFVERPLVFFFFFFTFQGRLFKSDFRSKFSRMVFVCIFRLFAGFG